MPRNKSRSMTLAAFIAAVYAVMTVCLPVPQYGAVQVRIAEAMTVLPILIPEAVPGLIVGCFIANLFSPFALDIVFGTAATAIAAVMTRRLKKRWLAPLPPIVCNALIVGFEITWLETGLGESFLPMFALNGLLIAVGEAIACCGLGMILLKVLGNNSYISRKLNK